MIGGFNRFEAAIATPTIPFGRSSGGAPATVAGALIEAPVLLAEIRLATRLWFAPDRTIRASA
jgi:ACR3 family arsenite efflux pump ArsB